MSAGLKANISADSAQHNAPEETSAHCRTSSVPEKTLTQHQSDASMDQNLYTTYQSGEMVSAMDFSLPGSPENASDSGQLPDLEQHMIPISEASFDNHGPAFLPESLGMRQDLMAQAYRGYQSQNDPSLVYQMPQQQLPQCQPQAARLSHTTRPIVQTHHSFPPVISTSNAKQMSHNSFVPPNSHRSSSGENQDQINSNSSSRSDNGSSFALSGLPETPDSIPDTGDLEARFENVFKAVEEAGFESIDDMSTQYYTANFKEDTVSHWAQSRSRSRSLHAFLASLHASTNNWSDREVQGYRQQITGAAESLYVSELSYAKKDMMQNRDTRSQTQGEKASSPVTRSAMSVQSLWQLIAEMEVSQDFKQKKTMIREKVSFSMAILDIFPIPVQNALSTQLIKGVVDAGDLVTSSRVDTKSRFTSTSRVPGRLCFSPSPSRV